MPTGQVIFVIKVAFALGLCVLCLLLITLSVNATTARFGAVGWVPLIAGILMLAAGLIVTWATAITVLDLRALRRYRADPDDRFEDGQTVALSGRVVTEGDALIAPFSQRPCAGYRYQVTAQRRDPGPDRGTRQQLCLLGFHLERAFLDCGSRHLALGAIADVDTDLRGTAMGGDWGERGLAMIRSGAEAWTHASEEQVRGSLEEALRETRVPIAIDRLVASTRASENQISVTEDIVPVDEQVTILGTYLTRTGGLAGRRIGGMKVFAGGFDERLKALGEELRKGALIATPLVIAGVALLTLPSWWPS
ncbi:MAG: hypothetical protein GVY32_02270 [Gammaproteobacteria bacterium]|jgi:hypothetical protein|nr:hypothetical protein [Gammaproteobacteria bacterium]